jgi:hypothetical protein
VRTRLCALVRCAHQGEPFALPACEGGGAHRALLRLLHARLLDEVADGALEVVDAVAHLVDPPDDRVRHRLEAPLLLRNTRR